MKKLLLIIFIFAGIIQISGQDSAWEEVGIMPYPVMNADAVVHNDKIYIIGGYSDSLQQSVNWVQVYDPVYRTWSIMTPMLAPRSGLSADIYNGHLFYFGTDEQLPGNTDIERWDFHPAHPSTIFDSDSTFNRVFSTGIIHNEMLYIIGGWPVNNNPLNPTPFLVEYDLRNHTIRHEVDTMFTGTLGAGSQLAAAYEDNIYIFGGIVFGISNNVFRYSTTSRNFSELELMMPTPRAGGTAVTVPDIGAIYLIGGFNETFSALGAVDILKMVGNEPYFIQGPDLITPRSEACAVYYGDAIYIFGGADEDGNMINSIERLSKVVLVDNEEVAAPLEFALEQNYPNPFNPSTTIRFSIQQSGSVTLSVYSILGTEIKVLENAYLQAGSYEYQWDGRDADGLDVASGIYFYSLRSGEFSQQKKMLLLR